MPGGGAADAAGFMSGLSPLGLMAAGGLLSGPQQYMQQRMGWLKTNMTGGTMSALFNISPSYGEPRCGGGGGTAAPAQTEGRGVTGRGAAGGSGGGAMAAVAWGRRPHARLGAMAPHRPAPLRPQSPASC
jgi:hypothetical protein